MVCKIIKIACFFVGSFFLFSCSPNPKKKTNDLPVPKVVEAKGHVVPADSIMAPKTFPALKADVEIENPIIVSAKNSNATSKKTFTLFNHKLGQDYPLIKIIGGEEGLYTPRSITEDKNGKMWYSSIGGVSIFDGEKIEYLNIPADSTYKVTFDIIQNKRGEFYFSYGNGIINKYDGKNIIRIKNHGDGILVSLEDKNGNLWFGADGAYCFDGQNFKHFKKENGLSSNSISMIIQDKQSKLWFSTWGGGITSYDGKIFTHFAEKQGLASNNFYTISDDTYGNLWFGSYGKGAICYNGKTFTTYTKEQGLANDTLATIFQDKAGNLWFGTFNGLSKISAQILAQLQNGESFSDPIFQNYGVNEGIKKGPFQPNSVCEDRNGNIWWGTSNGLLIYHPDRDKTAETPPVVQQSNWWEKWWFWTTVGILIIGSVNGYFRYKMRRSK